ncbi:hypothetical protein [Pectobacterium aroidearum]|nr:hypothetical protein [Pectobacterium aroidearum]
MAPQVSTGVVSTKTGHPAGFCAAEGHIAIPTVWHTCTTDNMA